MERVAGVLAARPSSAAPRGSCRGGRRRWAGCTRAHVSSSCRVGSSRAPTIPVCTTGAPVGWAAMSVHVPAMRDSTSGTDVSTPVYEGPFDLLLHLILREQVDIYEITLSSIVDAYLAEIERMELPRPRRRHRVPADRRHAGRAEGPPPAARSRRTSTSTTSSPCGRSATCCSPGCSSARRSRTSRRSSSELADDADLSFPRVVGPDERFAELVPDLLEGVERRRSLRNAAIRALTPEAGPGGRPVPRRPDPVERRRRRGRAARRAAACRAGSRSGA